MPKYFEELTWHIVEETNKRLCEKSGHQHGFTSEGLQPSKDLFESLANKDQSMAEAIDSLRTLHKSAPFLFLNGNTFCEIGLDMMRQNKINSKYAQTSAVHHIAGTSILSKPELEKIFNIPERNQEEKIWETTQLKIFVALKRGFPYNGEMDSLKEGSIQAMKQGEIGASDFLAVKDILQEVGKQHSPEKLQGFKERLAKMKVVENTKSKNRTRDI